MIASMPAKKKGQHGGRREGAGRKPLPEGHTSAVTVRLTATHIEKAERWQDAHGSENFSAAVREMIDAADAADPPV